MKREVDITAFKLFINQENINYTSRYRQIIYKRFVCFNWLYSCGYTLDFIGSIFDKSSRNGKMDHATVLHGIRQYKWYIEYPDFQDIVNELMPILQSFELEKAETIEEYDAMQLTELERGLLKCESYLDFLKLKNKLINELKAI